MSQRILSTSSFHRHGRVSRCLCGMMFALFVPACGGEANAPAAALPAFSKGDKPLAEPPMYAVGGFHIDLPKETLAPGEEREVCYLLPLDITGPSRIVGGGYVTVGQGMHHGNITSRPKTGEGIRMCPEEEPGTLGGPAGDIIDGGAVLFGSSTQVIGTEWQSFPAGMGFPVRENQEIVARMHYLNTSSEPLEVAPKYEWYTIDESRVEHLMGPFIWVLSGFKIPPKSEYTGIGGCRIPPGMNVVNVLPHVHQLGTRFTGEFMGGPLDGQLFLDSPGYSTEGVIVQYRPAIDLSQGEGARFSCTWQNTFDKTIEEGIGDNEMCMLFGYGYPYEQTYSAFATGPENCIALALPSLD
ncbi:MAG: hypothetical protein IPM54_08645 [Polyangiaceae bacterium]|nr:hypothetical protein [Polyangiaceae bacterium]